MEILKSILKGNFFLLRLPIPKTQNHGKNNAILKNKDVPFSNMTFSPGFIYPDVVYFEE